MTCTSIALTDYFRISEHPMYGSSRLGVARSDTAIYWYNVSGPQGSGEYQVSATESHRMIGKKHYELTNHLGNVLTVITDKKIEVEDATNPGTIAYYKADIVSAQEYYPFGMVMTDRQWSQYVTDRYRFGFNGMEKDDAFKGAGNSYDFGARIYDPRLGRWLSRDPLEKNFARLSTYVFAGNNPVYLIDVGGTTIVPSFSKRADNTSYTAKVTFLMAASPIYKAVHLYLNNDYDIFVIREMQDDDWSNFEKGYGIDQTAIGVYREDESSPNWGIIQNTNKILVRSGQFTTGTIFEESFHAYQSQTEGAYGEGGKEAEAKTAKMFTAYSIALSQGFNSADEVRSAMSTMFGLSSIEESLLFKVNEGKVEYRIQVKNYFDALLGGNAIGAELESSFRTAVQQFAGRILIDYPLNPLGSNSKYNGETPAFDKLVKAKNDED